MTVRITDLTFTYTTGQGPYRVFSPITCEFQSGMVSVLVGPSGCGKTTLFNIIAGLEQPEAGRVERTSERIGYVFQQPLLVPWLSVRRNALFGAELGHVTDGMHAKGDALLSRYGLAAFADAPPRQLSGGMQQRVAIIRALAAQPKIVLLDEPFAHSDFAMRRTMQDDISAITDDEQLTVLLATHDLHEAAFLADRILLLGGTPTRIIDDVVMETPRRERLSSAPAAIAPVLERLWRSFEGVA